MKKEDLTALRWLDEFHGERTDLSCPLQVEDEERQFAQSFFDRLGTTDLDGQLQHIEVHLQQACEAHQAARSRYDRCGKAYIATGVCIGLCLGLLLI